jgi:hypothetical protein
MAAPTSLQTRRKSLANQTKRQSVATHLFGRFWKQSGQLPAEDAPTADEQASAPITEFIGSYACEEPCFKAGNVCFRG